MKWLRIVLIALLFTGIAGLYIFSQYLPVLPSPPTSSASDFISRLNFALSQNQLTLNSGISTNVALDKCSFSLFLPDQQQPATVVLSLTTDPYFQVASLQKIINQSKMKNKHVVLIDLSLTHPYATQQDN